MELNICLLWFCSANLIMHHDHDLVVHLPNQTHGSEMITERDRDQQLNLGLPDPVERDQKSQGHHRRQRDHLERDHLERDHLERDNREGDPEETWPL